MKSKRHLFSVPGCLKQVEIENGKHFPDAASVIHTHFHMGDLLTSCDSIHHLLSLQKVIFNIMQSAGNVLRKWLTILSE